MASAPPSANLPAPVSGIGDRLAAASVLVAALLVVWMLLGVRPDPRGHGTHEQLGMAPCGWAVGGVPCPTCGVTTAACHLVHLQLWSAVAVQPFGAALAAAGCALAVWAGVALLRGRAFLLGLVSLPYPTIALLAVALFLASWLYKSLAFAT